MLALIWICIFTMLIIAVTDLFPNNFIRQYSFVIGIALITYTGFIKIYLSKLHKKHLKKETLNNI